MFPLQVVGDVLGALFSSLDPVLILSILVKRQKTEDIKPHFIAMNLVNVITQHSCYHGMLVRYE